MNNINHINLVSPVNNLGYGVHGTSMLKAFKNIGVDVSLEAIGDITDTYYNKEVNESIKDFKPESNTIHIFHDEYLKTFIGKDITAFTVFETDKVKPTVLKAINAYAARVLTPTEEHKAILQINGVQKPIHVVHEGVNANLYNSEETEKLIDTGKYTFLSLGKNEKRKNSNKVIAAFMESMQYKDAALILHTFLTKPILKANEMKKLYRSANVGVSVSAAEGWGLPEMECMACGVPCIISNCIGHSEYLEDIPVFKELIIEPSGKEVANDGKFFNGDVGNWYTTIISDVIDKMEYAYINNIGKAISKDLSNYIIDNYKWELSANKIKSILGETTNG